ncbi:MAG TPA: FAD/NAD(P)-binding protein, partial [Rubricoccaceae bacterium]
QSGPMPEATAATFAPRGLFGRYLAETLDRAVREAAPGVTLRVVRDTAVAVEPSGAVRLAGGETIRAERAVLALGQTTGGALPALADLDPDVLVSDPWAPGALSRVAGRVLLIGTGLTMLDVALALAAADVGPMTAVSRRGLVPHSHAPVRTAGEPAEAPAVDGLSATLRHVRAAADWRAAIDALRPTTAARWQALSDAERRSALRHLRPYWDVHRHRAAPDVAAAVAALQASGRLTILAGRVASAEAGVDGVRVRIARRRVNPPGEPGPGLPGGPDPGGGEVRRVFDHVVLCTGARPAWDTPVVAGLVAAGAARRDALGLGVETDPDGALVGADGRASGRLFTLGPLRQGTLWETTAIPEIRVQAAALATRLVAE